MIREEINRFGDRAAWHCGMCDEDANPAWDEDFDEWFCAECGEGRDG